MKPTTDISLGRSQESEREEKKKYAGASAEKRPIHMHLHGIRTHLQPYFRTDIFLLRKKKSNADINTDFHFTFFSLKALFKAVSLFALALKSLLFERALRREGKTFTECSKNQPITYNTVSCSLWAQRAEEWINPTHYSQRTSETHVQRGNLPSWPFNL